MGKAGHWAILIGLIAATAVCLALHPPEEGATAFAPAGSGRTLVLDAGHGGEDGGAVSLTGVPESTLNLSIVLKLDQLLGLYGQVPVVLRTEDRSLHDESAETLREKKVSDLHNRVSAVEKTADAVLLSVHQNTFTNQKYHGAQVFFAPTDQSQDFAVAMQETLRTALDPDNARQAKAVPDTVYLMTHISCPGILVECGFLSNPEEEALLRSAAYQNKLAAAMAAAWLQYDWQV